MPKFCYDLEVPGSVLVWETMDAESRDAWTRFSSELRDWLHDRNIEYNGRYIPTNKSTISGGRLIRAYRIGIRLYDPNHAMLYKLTWI